MLLGNLNLFVLGNCETKIFYVTVIQNEQNIVGSLSLRPARSGLLFM